MTTGETEETVTCGGQKRTDGRIGGGGGGEGNMKLSFTTLSTIAIQAGQSQIVVSVLRSGSVIHLQLVQVHPGLCEIGSNQEENQTLLQEQQQLMEKLKKHESEVLSAVEKSRQTEQRRKRDEGMMELKRSKKQEEEEGVYKAMNASLNEGWSLLLRLLERRQEVLTLASDFYRHALEFADSIGRLEDLQIRPDSDRLTEEQLTYDSMRRDLLGKSLQVLTCSSVLLQKLRHLQRTEALQRRGGVLQDEQEEDAESSQCSRGMALRLEELMEALQDRRRRADQAVRLQLQQVENVSMVHEKEKEWTGSDDWSLTVDQILDQSLQSGSTSAQNIDLTSTVEVTRDLKTGSRSDVNLESRSEPNRDMALGSRLEETINLDRKPESRSDLKPGSRFEETRELQPESRLDLQSGSRSDLQPGSGLDLQLGSRSKQTRDVTRSGSEENKNESVSRLDPKTESRSDVKPRSRLELKLKSRPDQPTSLQSGFKPNLKTGSRLKETLKLLLGSISDAQPGSGLDVNSESSSETTRDMTPESRAEETRNLDPKPETGSDLKHGARFEETSDLQSRLQLQSESRSPLQPGSGLDIKPESRLESKPESGSEDTVNLQSGFKLNLQSGFRSDLQPGSRSDPKPDSRADLNPGSRPKPETFRHPSRDMAPESRSKETRNLDPKPETGSDLEPKARLKETRDLQSRLQQESGSSPNLQPGSGLDVKTESRSEETIGLQSRFKLNLQSGPRSDMQPGSRLDPKPDSRADLNPGSRPESSRDEAPESRSEETRNLDPKPETGSDLEHKARLKETRDLQSRLQQQSGSRPDLQPGSGLDVKTESRSEETISLQSRFKLNLQSEPRSDMQPGSRLDPKPDSRADLNPGSRPESSRDEAPESRSEETRNLDPKPETGSDLEPKARLKETRDLQSRLQQQSGSRPDLQPGSGLDVKTESRSEETISLQSRFKINLQSGPRSDMQPGSRLETKPEPRSDLNPECRSESSRDEAPESRSQETTDLQSRPRSEESGILNETTELRIESPLDVKSGSGSEKTKDLHSGSRSEAEDVSLSEPSRKQEEAKQHRAASTNIASGQVGGLESMLGNKTQSGEDHARQALLANQRQQLQQLVDKLWSWVQQGSSVLSNSSEAGRQLLEAEDTLNTHLQLQTQAETAGHDAEKIKQILDQIRPLHSDQTSRTSPLPPSEPSRQLSPLKALTEQLKKGSMTRTGAARLVLPAVDPSGSLSPELAGRADLVLKELQSLNRKINSNLQLLQPYVTFLRTAQQVEEEMEELREILKRRPEEEEEEKHEEREAGSSSIRTASSCRSPVKKKDVDACWQAAEQKFLTAQDQGNNYVHTVSMVSGAELNLQSVVSVVQQTLERLSRIKEEVNELQSQQQLQIQQQQEYCRKYQESLLKTMQDLNCVSELLDSCTMMDLGSDLQTSKLLERFSQAKPHFKQLDAEVEYMQKNWETLRGVQDRLEMKELKGRAVKEEDLSELLKLQNRVKNKIHQSESILDLTSSFHSTSQQLEALIQSDLASPLTGSTGLCGSNEAELSRLREEQQQKIQNLFKAASTLKTDICNAINQSGWTHFRVEQLEARLLSLDSLCISWQNEAARREEKLRRELLTCRLNDDINQLRDSFKELKKRFSNLKFNYQKRNDRARNMKAVRNQLQQVELYDEKLQALRKRLQGVTARLGSEIKDGGVAREAEDAVNELQRQMGDFERSVSEHQKTLDMTRRLQQAMEEYQFWCEEASATIARVGKFSSECRSTEAVSVLYRQFEKFVWPTVPQQEERISQIAELAVRLHGVEEGQRYIEKTVSKHSEMVESIRELSDGLMKLEAKLKLENLKKQQKDEEKVMKDNGETERRRESETEEKDGENEKKLKENRKLKKTEQTDNRSTQEATDMCELKETGHTPELTAEHDGKEVPVKRQTAANRKPPLQKSRSLDTDRQSESRQHSEKLPSSYCSTHTFSLSCSPVEANRRIHTIHSQLQFVTTEPQATPPPSVIGPLFSDIQREFQRKEMQETGQPGVSAFGGSSTMPLQDASAGGLLEAELQQQEAMTEDSLSNDEYDCVSPDDISLPPLADTPESNIFQSDVEEGFCFSSHSVHISQYSHHSEHSGTGPGALRQLRVSSRTESCPTPPTSRHSSTRFRSDSSSFVQSPLTVPAPSLLTSTMCTILRTGETSTANVPLATDPDLSFPSGSNPAHKNDTPDSCPNKDNSASEKRISSHSESFLKRHNMQYNESQKITGTQVKITQNVASKGDTLPQTDPIPKATELNKTPTLPQPSYCPQPFNGPDPDLHKDKTTPQDTRSLKCSTTFPKTTTATCFPQSFPGSDSGLHQDLNSSRTYKETPAISKPQTNSLTNTSTSKITQKTIHCQSSPLNSRCTLPQASSHLISPQESPVSQSETLPRISPVPQDRRRAQSSSLTESILHKYKTQDTGFLKSCATSPQTNTTIPQDSNLPQTYLDSKNGLDQDVPSSQTSKETSSVSVPQSSSLTTATTVTQQTIFCPSSHPNSAPQESSIAQSQTLPRIDPVPQARGFAQRPSLADTVLNKDRTQDTGFLKSHATCPKSSTTIPQDRNLSQSYPDSRSDVDQNVPSSQTSKETSSVSKPQSSSLTTAITVTQKTVYCQSSPPDNYCNVPQASNSSRSQQGSPFPQGHGGLPEAHVPILPKADGFSNISISSSAITSSHQTVCSLHESLSSTCTQQCVHDPGMTPSSPAKPTAPPQPVSQTQALAQQANPHVTPLSSPPHLLTPDQDPNICQPMVVREEIRLTPQIQGPSLPAPPTLPQAQAESLPQGKASKSGPPCFTRPLSRATVMEGSPVTLEVEVTGHPDPTLTWSKDGEVSATGPGRALACEASDSDGGLYEVRTANYHDAQRAAGNSSGDKWLVAEVFDIISMDWQNWFGTLCVLLWLIYLIVL